MATQSERTAKTLGAIKRAAREEFSRVGFSKTSVDRIAATAGVTKGAVYHHFEAKTDIFKAVLTDVTQELSESVAIAIDGTENLVQIARQALESYFSSCKNFSALNLILEQGPGVLGREEWRALSCGNLRQQVTAFFATGVQAGVLIDHDPVIMADMFNVMIHEGLMQSADAEDFDATSARYIDAILLVLERLKL